MRRKIKSNDLSLRTITRLLNLSKDYDYSDIFHGPTASIVRVRDVSNKLLRNVCSNLKSTRRCKSEVYPKSHLGISTSFLVDFFEHVNHL
jgi:hypothetical protein